MMALILILAVAVIGIALAQSFGCMGAVGICRAVAKGEVRQMKLASTGKQPADNSLPTLAEVVQCEAMARAARRAFVRGVGWAVVGVAAAAFAGFILGQGGL